MRAPVHDRKVAGPLKHPGGTGVQQPQWSISIPNLSRFGASWTGQTSETNRSRNWMAHFTAQ